MNHDEPAALVALIARAARLTAAEAVALADAWNAAAADRAAAWKTARAAAAEDAGDAAWDAEWAAAEDAGDAAWYAAWNAAAAAGAPRAGSAAFDAALALAGRGLISDEHYRALTGPWRAVIGEIDLPATGRNEQ